MNREEIIRKIKNSALFAKDKAEDFTKIAVKKTKDVLDTTKYTYTIGEIKNRKKECLAELGEKLYTEYKNGTEFEGDILKICERIDELQTEIDEVKEKIVAIKEGTLCTECGEILPKESTFCSKCGTRIEE